jgi:hypothetical protein
MKKIFNLILTVSTVLIFWTSSEATVYYIDSNNGNDADKGISEAEAWQTISKVNQFQFKPGDHILFRRGATWREQLIPQSGDEQGYITYGAYGDGNKPLSGMPLTCPLTRVI